MRKRRPKARTKKHSPPTRQKRAPEDIRPSWLLPAGLIIGALIVVVAAFALGRSWLPWPQNGDATEPSAVAVATASTSAEVTDAAAAITSGERETGSSLSTADGPGVEAQPGPAVPRLKAMVITALPHDPTAFTQGLLLDGASLYESTGMYGDSTLREVDPSTGAVKRRVELAPDLFGEGLALVDDHLVQLTWRAGIALVHDRTTFEEVGRHTYSGEGWGLCFDGEHLVMSNGSNELTFRDPVTFETLRTLPVTVGGQPVTRLNELECVEDAVYANVWQTDDIVEIDAETGEVRAVIDAAGLLAPDETEQADVLNGIAYDSDRDVFLITGKWWPKLFEVRFEQERQAFLPGIVTGF